MNKLANEMKSELKNHILPFWMKLIDRRYGGFFGKVDGNLNIVQKAEKGSILNSRILWTFSSAYLSFKAIEYLEFAHHSYQFLRNNLIDKKFGGLFWSTDFKGIVKNDSKHIYNIAFAIYALSEYYLATKDDEVKSLAISLFNLIESKGKDVKGYLEEFDIQWNVVPNVMLSESGVIADRTLNTHLHLLEAYTNLYRIWKHKSVKDQICFILKLFDKVIFDRNTNSFKVFFDINWNSLVNLQSFGHDIEATWLINKALDITGLENQNLIEIIKKVSKNIQKVSLIDNSILNESFNGKIDTDRIWWVQTEAIVGFLNFYQLTGDKSFLKDATNIWRFIKNFIIDNDENGEWNMRVSKEFNKYPEDDIVGPWKCPYHNSRMCLEIIERNKCF
ncbi:MAG: AGE family epimerase/isomerase [Candidatus Thorarchaeota archaeon]